MDMKEGKERGLEKMIQEEKNRIGKDARGENGKERARKREKYNWKRRYRT